MHAGGPGGLGSFLGREMQQRWEDLALWERVLNEARQVTGIIELGTGSGAFSSFLLLQCVARGLWFATFDRGVAEAVEDPVQRRLDLQACCYVGDLWGSCGDELRGMFARKRRRNGTQINADGADLRRSDEGGVLLFCDNGQKAAEVAAFGVLLRPGDVLGVHDWGTEIGPEDMGCMDGRLVELAEGVMTKFWWVA